MFSNPSMKRERALNERCSNVTGVIVYVTLLRCASVSHMAQIVVMGSITVALTIGLAIRAACHYVPEMERPYIGK